MVKERTYRIAWRATLTGATGHGMRLFTRQHAQDIADGLNAGWGDPLHDHWVERIDAKNEQEDVRE